MSLVLSVATLLASYLISRQVREMQTDLEVKASTYGRLVSKEVESAIANVLRLPFACSSVVVLRNDVRFSSDA
jgi:hypothetical protein